MSGQMTKIGAWIRDPAHNFLKGQTKHTALFELYCQDPSGCDLLKAENSCLHCGSVSNCPFGRKSGTEGPTRKARSYYSTVAKWRERNEGFLNKLASLKAYKRVFKAQGHFYMPYSWMTSVFSSDNAPLQSKWVAETKMTTELLGRLCTYQPRSLMGGVIRDYQENEIPKFITDLHAFYPEIFDRLPDDQKARFKTISYVGRTADINTCAPGKYVFAKQTWDWDGETLSGFSMLFQPVAGKLTIKIKPNERQPVTITDNAQVTSQTKFLD